SQDADISLDDDGDYFTWTLDEAEGALDNDELQVAMLRYDIGETGEMHHNPAKNVLYIRTGIDEIAQRIRKTPQEVEALLEAAKKKMYAARLKRPTPFVDKTIYVSWNALCISAYLQAAQVLELETAQKFALRSLDRILSQAWNPQSGLLHVIAYSDPQAAIRQVPGVLEDYVFTAIACLDGYEASSDLTYYEFAEKIAEAMIIRFHDATEGGFFDIQSGSEVGGDNRLGALTARRKPLQDSPTPAGNPEAAILLLRLHAYSNKAKYMDFAEEALQAFAGIAAHYGMFAATYGIALNMYLHPHTQVVIAGSGRQAEELRAAAIRPFSLHKSVLHLPEGEVVPQMLPPALAQTIPTLPAIKEKNTVAVLCSNFTCQPPITDAAELASAISTLSRAQGGNPFDREKQRA
ncbi:MAG: thioredoxin domain-containing protein, partial [Candidatus Angelobacter sp.]